MDHVEKWKKLKFGMFIHFGLYSLLGGIGRLLKENPETVERGKSSTAGCLELKPEDAELLFRITGKDYYSTRPVASQKRWLVEITRPGTYEVELKISGE